jgi:hypothetical protein
LWQALVAEAVRGSILEATNGNIEVTQTMHSTPSGTCTHESRRAPAYVMLWIGMGRRVVIKLTFEHMKMAHNALSNSQLKRTQMYVYVSPK